MRTDEFVHQVQQQAHISLGDQALKIIEATLSTLGERLTRDERRDLAAQLPQQLKDHVLAYEETTRFSLEEFYNRVAACAEVGLPDAIERSQVVMSVLDDAVTAGQLDKVRRDLPEEFEELLGKTVG